MWFGFYPKEEGPQQIKHEHVTLRRIFALFHPYTKPIMGLLLCVLLSSMLGVVPAYLTAQIIDGGIIGHNLSLLIMFAGLGLLVEGVMGLLGVGQGYLSTSISQRIMADLRERLYCHLLSLSLRFFGNTRLGDLVSRFINDIGGIQMIVTTTLVNTLSSAATVIVTLIFMFAYNWLLTLFAIVVIPLFVLPTQRVGKKNRQLSRLTQEQLAHISTFLEETLDINGMLLIKSFGRQQHEMELFAEASQTLAQLTIRQALLSRWFFMFLGLVTAIGPVMIYVIGGVQSFHGSHITIGEMVAFVALLERLYIPASQFASIWVSIQGAFALLERIFAVLDEQPDVQDVFNAQPLPSIQGQITFDNVSFAYQEQATISNVSFTVKPGQMVALVGPSGAGKTTITYLLARFYDVTCGAVCIDGHNVQDMQFASLAALIGIVTQEPYLFHASLRDNIAYSKPSASHEDIINAARSANIHDVIMQLPEGYNTVVGERGYKLSGGEKQRIALARVILKNPRILIMDEATSSLDSQSEALIQSALVPIFHERTTLIIAHRLSTILAADLILVLDGGWLVEQGTHQELITQDGLYAKLYREQFRGEPERY